MPKVLVPLAKGFEEIEAVSMIDIMRRGGIEVLVRSLDDTLEVEGANGITVKADASIIGVTADEIDMIALPGGWGGTYALADDVNVQALLKAMDEKGKNIGAICAAPFALKKAGVLKETYTCYPSVEEEIKVSSASVSANLGYDFLDGQLRPFGLIGLSYVMSDYPDVSNIDASSFGVHTGLGVSYVPKVLKGVGFRAAWTNDFYNVKADKDTNNLDKDYAQLAGMFYLGVDYNF